MSLLRGWKQVESIWIKVVENKDNFCKHKKYSELLSGISTFVENKVTF